MSYAPKKSQREYIKPLWKMKKDGTKGDLVCHTCAKCAKQIDGKKPGTWLQRADNPKIYRFVCGQCYPVK